MTRFARAKGSKSSNERVPEDSTPWEVMKDQMMQAKKAGEDSKHREEAEKQRIENYEKFLKDHKTQKRKASWCDFPESQTTITSNGTTEPAKKKNKTTTDEKSDSLNNNSESNLSKTSKKKKPKNKNANPNSEKQPTNANENKQSIVNKKDEKVNKQNDAESATIENKESLSDQPAKKKKKNKKFEQKTGSDDVPSTENKQKNKNQNQNANANNQKVKKKKKKQVNGEPVRRKPVNDSFQLIINGKEVELVRYDGFPIMKKDAERLAELKANMIKKGIPKSEVQRTMKLERRRAEKALARVKRDVCYNCRKGGHNLSDCPDLKTKIPNVGAPDGLCFKCGSTEHRQFECKVQKDGGFRFATCFICKEPGHIARQCPDNPKGLYPNGGSCKLCGDVTHLRKDCPTVQDKREDSSIKLQTLDSAELEGITETTKNTASEMIKKPKKISF